MLKLVKSRQLVLLNHVEVVLEFQLFLDGDLELVTHRLKLALNLVFVAKD